MTRMIFLLLLIPNLLFGQRVEKKYELYKQEPVLVQYQTKKENGRLLKGEDFFINFDNGFQDTVLVYLDGKLVKKQYCVTNDATGTTGLGLKIGPNTIRKKPLLTVIIPNKNVFIEIILDSRFKKLELNRMEEWKQWNVVFTNFIRVVM